MGARPRLVQAQLPSLRRGRVDSLNDGRGCLDDLERAVEALAARGPCEAAATGRRESVTVMVTYQYECDPIPRTLAQASCATLNRRWIHPCHVVGMCFSVAEGYACPLCKLTFERQRAGEKVYEAPR